MTKVLLVEDDKSLREIYGVRLLAEGYDIVSAGDGEEALAMAIKERPALIVSDVMMPKISGFDMLDILRSTTETKDIKVIMMTALSSEDQRQRGESLGADRYLVKSQVGIEDVVRAVHEVLGDLPGMTPAAPPAQASAPTDGTQPNMPQPAPAPAPQTVATTPSAPAPPITPDSPAPTAVTSQPLPTPSTGANLPQPTAPFSSSTPRPNSLGDRTIQPLQNSNDAPTDFSELINQELASTNPVPAPVANDDNPQLATDSNVVAESQQRPDIADLSPSQQPADSVQPQATPQQTTAIPTQPAIPEASAPMSSDPAEVPHQVAETAPGAAPVPPQQQ